MKCEKGSVDPEAADPEKPSKNRKPVKPDKSRIAAKWSYGEKDYSANRTCLNVAPPTPP